MCALDASNVKKTRVQPYNNVYTALMGLAVLTLAATACYVCWQSWDMFGQVFSIAGL